MTVRLPFRMSRYFLILTLVWIAATSWKIYPHFRDALRSDGHIVAFADYVDETCGQKVGANAEVCYTQAVATGRKLVAREQAKSFLLILAPLLLYGVYLPLSLLVTSLASFGRSLRRRISFISPDPIIAPTPEHP